MGLVYSYMVHGLVWVLYTHSYMVHGLVWVLYTHIWCTV